LQLNTIQLPNTHYHNLVRFIKTILI